MLRKMMMMMLLLMMKKKKIKKKKWNSCSEEVNQRTTKTIFNVCGIQKKAYYIIVLTVLLDGSRNT